MGAENNRRNTDKFFDQRKELPNLIERLIKGAPSEQDPLFLLIGGCSSGWTSATVLKLGHIEEHSLKIEGESMINDHKRRCGDHTMQLITSPVRALRTDPEGSAVALTNELNSQTGFRRR